MNKSSIKAIKKFNLLSAISYVAMICLCCVVLLIAPNSIPKFAYHFLIIIIILLHTFVVNRVILRNTLLTTLTNDLDAPAFYHIVNKRSLYLPEKMQAALEIGDYQTVVNVATDRLCNEKRLSPSDRDWYLSLLSWVYFELRDFEELKAICDKHQLFEERYNYREKSNGKAIQWKYYQYFLEKNYEACKELCEAKKSLLKNRRGKENYQILRCDFMYAVACYSNGDLEEANAVFENIIATSPKMQRSQISRKYVEAIKTNSELGLFEKITPKKDHQYLISENQKKRRRAKISTCAFLVCYLLFTVWWCVSVHTAEKEYEKDLNNALLDHYQQAEFIKYFYNEQGLDQFCIIDKTEGLSLGSVGSYDKGETLAVVILIDDIEINKYYSVESALSSFDGFYFGIQVCTDKKDDTYFDYVVEFVYHNDTYWLGIDYLGNILES